jgi:hypothetical protein
VIRPLDVQAAIDWAALCRIISCFIADNGNNELQVVLERGIKQYFHGVNSFQMYINVYQLPQARHLRGALCVC